jgi:hypothetical protein
MSVPAKRALLFAIVALILVGFLTFSIHHMDGYRVVGRCASPDGTEMMMYQKCNWSLEPFTTRFVFKRPDETWGAFYYDHEDLYWGRSPTKIDTNKECVIFYRGLSPAVTFFWKTETFTLHRWNRTLTGAQWNMPKGWKFGDAMYDAETFPKKQPDSVSAQ